MAANQKAARTRKDQHSRTQPPCALSIAGSDSSAGAGIQADLKTFSALGVYGATVITALTAQNTRGVRSVHWPPAAFIRAQLQAVLDDLPCAAVKIGMLGNEGVVREVAGALACYGVNQSVLDPVLVSSSGKALMSPDGLERLKSELIPRVGLITPNLPEVAALLGCSQPSAETQMITAARSLQAMGAQSVLIKGGHLQGEQCLDLLLHEGQIHRFPAARIHTANTHGTGCTLSAAITAYLALGEELVSAVQLAKTYLTGAIAAADRLHVGEGAGPLHHFHSYW
jgi:hydroxymethylpyrimidine/phosphomethylpyrimidine kinase